jgi:DNA-binding transcriptional LysR family regulator
MEMHQVRYFLALCEERNFTRAAKRCGVAQPSLTRAIKVLEDELGGALFHRSRSSTQLTHLGRAAWPYLKQIDESASAAKAASADLINLKAEFQPQWRRKIALTRSILLSAAVLVPILGVSGVMGTSLISPSAKPAVTAPVTINTHKLQLAVDVRTLPEQEIKEPF